LSSPTGAPAQPAEMKTDVVVVGAGAAGLLAALFAGRSGARTILLERTRDGGRKILISGGGRCNVLPGTFRPERYVTDSSPNSLRKILRSWPLDEQRRFFEEDLGIPLKHETDGDKLFPVSDRARDVRDALVTACREAGVEVRFNHTVAGVERCDSGGWRVRIESGPELETWTLILATGGLSVPATGSDGRGLSWVASLGHRVHPPYPALTPLLSDPAPHAHLAGVSLEVAARAGSGRSVRDARGGFLFTHRGYSGPAVLDLSHMPIRGGDEVPVEVAWTGEDAQAWEDRLQEGRGALTTLLGRHLPQRLVGVLMEEAGVPEDRRLSQLRREERQRLVERLSAWPMPWTGDEGYKKAEVTGGGVALEQVDPVTMESRVEENLYLCGEILDAFGPIGGHNFLWAWATGRAAGSAAAASVLEGRSSEVGSGT